MSTEGGLPRIAPGSRSDIGIVNWTVARALGAATGGPPPRIFTTLGKNRRLFRRWLLFAGGLMPGGRLPRLETELVILRVAHNCDCEYEWRHHEQLGAAAGVSEEEIARVQAGADAAGWTERQADLLRAADQLHAERWIDDALWGRLSARYREAELIELCMLVGHYEMLAMTLRTLGVQPDPLPGDDGAGPGRLGSALQALASRRMGAS